MRILTVNGSPRPHGNTGVMLKRVSSVLVEAGHEVDDLFLEAYDLRPCGACMACARERDGKCHGRNDDGNAIIARTVAADVILLGSPVYFGSLTGQMKAYLDRVGFVSRVSTQFLNRKIGAAVVPARRAGQLLTFAELNMWFLINGMIVPGSTYWNVGQGMKEGDVAGDAEAMTTLDELAKNLLWLMEKTA
ncbi:MAG: flavodoxin family protein [Phycisphaerae bacterium]|nr:flavodoxin family protein [Phycisphaerae bacterium]